MSSVAGMTTALLMCITVSYLLPRPAGAIGGRASAMRNWESSGAKGTKNPAPRFALPLKAFLDSVANRCRHTNCFLSDGDATVNKRDVFRLLDRNLDSKLTGAELEGAALGLGVKFDMGQPEAWRDMRLISKMKQTAKSTTAPMATELTMNEFNDFLCAVGVCGKWVKENKGVERTVTALKDWFQQHVESLKNEASREL